MFTRFQWVICPFCPGAPQVYLLDGSSLQRNAQRREDEGHFAVKGGHLGHQSREALHVPWQWRNRDLPKGHGDLT